MAWTEGDPVWPFTDADVDAPESKDCGSCLAQKNADKGGQLQLQDEPVWVTVRLYPWDRSMLTQRSAKMS